MSIIKRKSSKKNPSIKMVAIDLDGTLLDDDKKISLADKEAILKINNLGIKVVIASGRPYFRIKPILQELKLDNNDNYVISYNGGRISLGDGSLNLLEIKFNNEEINEIINFLLPFKVCFNLYNDDDIYTSLINPEIAKFKVYEGINFKMTTNDDLKKMNDANKIILADDTEKIATIQKALTCDLLSKYNIVRSTPNFLEFLPLNSSKGKAVKYLEDLLKLTPLEAMAIGDEENDISMLDAVYWKVAMEDGNEKLQKKAYFITSGHNQSGVSLALQELILKDLKK